MKRRKFLLGAVSTLAACPLALHAQQPGRVWRVGFIAHRYEKFYDPLFSGLRELGYVEGQNLIIERRYAEGDAERFKEFAAEMVRLNVDAIIVVTTPAGMAARNETKTIPIVHPAAIDPEAGWLISHELGRFPQKFVRRPPASLPASSVVASAGWRRPHTAARIRGNMRSFQSSQRQGS